MRKYVETCVEMTIFLLRIYQTFASFDPCTECGITDVPERIRGLIFLFSPCPLLITPVCFFPMSLLLPSATSLWNSLLLGQGLICLDININNFIFLQGIMYILVF